MILINGEQTEFLNATDRGLQYGDGVFETIAVRNGQAVMWNEHVQRLLTGCERLGITVPDILLVANEARQLTASLEQGVLKIIITRGIGGRGYQPPKQCAPTRILSTHPWPCYPASYTSEGIAVRVCQTRLGLNPSLAGLKHLNRLEQVLARNEWGGDEFAEGLLLDTEGHVIEATMCNVFTIRNDTLITPDISQCGVEGIARNMVLAIAREKSINTGITNISLDDVYNADEVFLCNSVVGIWPVNRVEEHHYSRHETTQIIQKAYNKKIG